MVVGQRVPASSREEALLQFAKGVFNRLFDMSQGKEDSAADVPLLRVEVGYATLPCYHAHAILRHNKGSLRDSLPV